MGLFDNIKKIVNETKVDKVDLTLERAGRVDRLLNSAKIKNASIIKKLVIKFRDSCNVSFGEEINEAEVAENFQLQAGENAIFYLIRQKMNILSPTEVILVVTDVSIYCNPKRIKNTAVKSNRVEILDLYKFVVQYRLKDGYAGLYSKEKIIILYEKNIISSHLSSNNEIQIIFDVLDYIQKECFEKDNRYIEARYALMNWLDEEVNKNIKEKTMPSYLCHLMDRTKEEDILYVKSMNLLLKNFLYRRQWSDLLGLVYELKDLKDLEKAELFSVFESNILKYIKELKNPNVAFAWHCIEDSDYLADRTIDINQVFEPNSTKEGIINIYNKYSNKIEYLVAIRNNNQLDEKDFLFSLNFNKLLDGEQKELLSVYYYFRNYSMRALYESVKENNYYNNYDVQWKDAYGLSLLHYALMLHNDAAIENCIKKYNTGESILNLDNELSILRNYAVVSILTNNASYTKRIISLSSDFEPLYKNIKVIKRKITAQKALVATMDFSASVAERQLNCVSSEVSDEMIDEQMDNISGVLDGVESIRESIEALESELEEIYEEIESLAAVIYDKCAEWAEKIKRSTNPLLKGFLKIYDNNVSYLYDDDFNHFYISDAFGKLFLFYERLFEKTVYGSGKETKEKQEDTIKEFGNEKVEKLYGDSWFSPKAHSDYKLLIKEFHQLAVKYHPDNNVNTISVFLEIQEEKAIILDGLNIK